MPAPKSGGQDPESRGGPPLPGLNELPPDAEDEPLPSDAYGDYTTFLEHFKHLATRYSKGQRLWPKVPLNFEVDGLLNYLFLDAPGLPSRPYMKRKPRNLTPAQQQAAIRKYAKQFAQEYHDGNLSAQAAMWRGQRARTVRGLLDKNRKTGLSRSGIDYLLLQTNAMNAYRTNLAKVRNPENIALKDIQKILRHLIDDKVPIQRRMSDCTGQVPGVGKAAIQELRGLLFQRKISTAERKYQLRPAVLWLRRSGELMKTRKKLIKVALRSRPSISAARRAAR